MKAFLLTLLSVFTIAAPVAASSDAPIVGLLSGPVFAEGGGHFADIGVGLLDDHSGVARNLDSGLENDLMWVLIDSDGNTTEDLNIATHLVLMSGGWTFVGFIHGGPDGHRFVFGKWWCASGNRGHILFEVLYDGC